jgi:hypothetical protein
LVWQIIAPGKGCALIRDITTNLSAIRDVPTGFAGTVHRVVVAASVTEGMCAQKALFAPRMAARRRVDALKDLLGRSDPLGD